MQQRLSISLLRPFSNLVKVEDQVQLTDVVKVFVQHLHKVVDGLKMGDSEQVKKYFCCSFYLEVVKVVVTDVHTDAEVEASVPNI